ncbi:MAG: transposase [Lewinellaceae bacterium]|nr:transposase [Lewinellaceae bacterium]
MLERYQPLIVHAILECLKGQAILEAHFSGGRPWGIPAFSAYLQEHAPQIRAKKNMYPRILESLALGHYHEQVGFPVVKSLLSDDAPEYLRIALWLHALCWIHDARHYNKLTPKIELHRSIKEEFQNKYWQFYYQLLDFKELPASRQEAQKLILKQQFESLFKPSTNYFQLNECISRTLANKDKLLAALENPALPLHNNGMELGARRVVRKRDISLHSWSKTGTKVRDAFMSIVETANKLGVNAMEYIADRISQKHDMPHLADLVRQAYA